MKDAFSAVLALALGSAACAADVDDFGFADDAPAAAPADPWAGITQLFPAPGDAGAGRGEKPRPSLSLVGEFDLPDDAPEGLSGIAWRGGTPGLGRFADDLYGLVEDSGGRLHAATVGIDRETGAVTNAVVSPAGSIPGAADLEGVACGCIGSTPVLFASDERGPAVFAKAAFDTTGPDWTSLPLPEPLRRCRPNRSLEALALSTDGRILWTANEDALPEDGPVATVGHGSRVRLYALDAAAAGTAAAPPPPPWWFYELDPATGTGFPHLPDPFNGLAALCALPDGRLLALERGYGFRTRSPEDPRGSLITISIYLVDPLRETPARLPSPVSRRESHAESAEVAEGPAAARPDCLAKTLLWRGLAGRANYEGMTLGPALADGSRALLLVADGDVTRKGRFSFAWRKSLLAFRLDLP